MVKAATDVALDKSIRRLGGEAARETSSPRAAIAAESNGAGEASTPAPLPAAAAPTVERNVWGEEVEVPPFEERLDVGWFVWRGSPEGDLEHRKCGMVVDAEGAGSVVVVCDRVRGGAGGRQETWFEVWPIADLDEVNSHDPGSPKRVQTAKRLLMSIGETIKAGRWTEEDERRMAAAAVLTADVARAWRAA